MTSILKKAHRLSWYFRIQREGLFDAAYYLRNNSDAGRSGLDAILHYARIGWREGRQPSSGFDVEWYLEEYEDVRRAGIDPLLHYARAGRREGRSPLPPQDSSFDSNKGAGFEVRPPNPVVYLSCWLQQPESIHDAIRVVSTRLGQHGVRLVIATDAPTLGDDPDLEIVFSTPRLSGYGRPKGEESPPWIHEIALVESRWLSGASRTVNQGRFDSARVHALAAYEFWQRELAVNRPALMLVWGSTAPVSRLHLKLCHDLGIPTLILERGHFPDTLSVDVNGQFGHGRLNRLPIGIETLRSASDDHKRYATWIRNDDSAPYRDSNTADGWPELERKLKGRDYVLMVGANDLGSGSAFRPTECPERHSLLFRSSVEAARYFKKILPVVAPNTCFVFKPHPASSKHGRLPSDTEHSITVRDVNVNQLIAKSAVTITMSTTATIRAAVEDVPILLVGLSELSFKGIAYEAHSSVDIPVALRAALSHEGFEEKRQRARTFLAYLFEHYLVGLSSDVPTRLSLNDLFETILQSATRYLPVEQRKVDFQLQRTKRSRAARRSSSKNSPPVDVVIPVYADAKITEQCLASVLDSELPATSNVIVINDASPDDDVVARIERFGREQPRVILLTNETNLGFPATANRGMAYHRDRDVILLNSDTLVPSHFVQRLRDTAYSHVDIATVTPLSNNASIFSIYNFPRGGELSDGIDEVRATDAALQRQASVTVDVPVGNGFCLYIRRNCLDLIGGFDDLAFGRGYSEEVDFCQRAREHGFRHLCATGVFVGHVGGVSFGQEAEPRKRRARDKIRARYPNYFDDIKQFIDKDPMRSIRDSVSSKNPLGQGVKNDGR